MQDYFRHLSVGIADEVSMISEPLLTSCCKRAQELTGNFTELFGGLKLLLTGDVDQTDPINSPPLWKTMSTSDALGSQLMRQCLRYTLTGQHRFTNMDPSGFLQNVLTRLSSRKIFLKPLELHMFAKSCPHCTTDPITCQHFKELSQADYITNPAHWDNLLCLTPANQSVNTQTFLLAILYATKHNLPYFLFPLQGANDRNDD